MIREWNMKLDIVILPKIPPTHAYTLHINGPYIQIPPAMAFTVTGKD